MKGEAAIIADIICETGWSWADYCNAPRWLTNEINARLEGRAMASKAPPKGK